MPVGEDQKQHLELARDIAQQRINARFGSESSVLNVPKPLILKEGAQVMSLTDGLQNEQKRSERRQPNHASGSTGNNHQDQARKTDPQMGLEFDNPERPETHNLLSLYALLSGKGREAAATECADMGWGKFKPLLAEATVAALEPIQARHRELMEDPAELDQVLAQGREKAETVANATLERVRHALGFHPRH